MGRDKVDLSRFEYSPTKKRAAHSTSRNESDRNVKQKVSPSAIANKRKGSNGENTRASSSKRVLAAKGADINHDDPLHDVLKPGLDLVFVGINPGIHSARHGRHYAGPNNAFWPLLYESGLVTEPLTFAEDDRSLEWNIGLTNIVQRTSPSSQDLSKSEIATGAVSLRSKLQQINPRIVCFNGKGIYEVFSGINAKVYVMPSTSGRTSTYPTRSSKLPFFEELRQLLDNETNESPHS